MTQIAFDRVKHFARIVVRLDGNVNARFLVDTGIGITVVHSSVAARLGAAATGQYQTGHRMSGQELTLPLVRLPNIQIGDRVFVEPVAGVVDLGDASGPDGFDGILGLDLLGELPLTINPNRHVITLGEPAPLAPASIRVPVRLNRVDRAVDMRADLRLPNGQIVEVEIDTGSRETILDTRLMPACSVDGTVAGSRVDEGLDETGNPFHRTFTRIRGSLAFATAAETAAMNPVVMFQQIGLDGLVGTDFLDRYIHTHDTRNAQLTLTRPNAELHRPFATSPRGLRDMFG